MKAQLNVLALIALTLASCGRLNQGTQEESLTGALFGERNMQTRVFNGSGAKKRVVGALFIGSPFEGFSICSATLMSRELLLTAAHCVTTGKNTLVAPEKIAFTNDQDALRAPARAFVRAVAVRSHPGNDNTRFDVPDLAIVKLSSPVTGELNLPKINDKQIAISDAKYKVIGYGDSDTISAGPDGDLIFDTGAGIQRKGFIRLESFSPVMTLGVVVRAGLLNFVSFREKTGQVNNLCPGDSGGPVVGPVQGKNRVVGVASFAFSGGTCASVLSSSFVSTAPFSGWILKTASELGGQQN